MDGIIHTARKVSNNFDKNKLLCQKKCKKVTFTFCMQHFNNSSATILLPLFLRQHLRHQGQKR